MRIYLLKKRKGFGAFQFLIFVLPAAPAATIVEAAATIGVKAAPTVDVTSTAAVATCRCLMSCNYRTCSKHQYRSYDTSDNKYCSYPCIHYTIKFYYVFILDDISLHKL
jgi:hypothetical protein